MGICRRRRLPAAQGSASTRLPIVLAMVLGPMMEQALRQGLMMSKGEFGDLPEPAHLGGDAGGAV